MHWFSLLALLVMASCGKSPTNRAGVPVFEPKALPLDGSNVEGLYMAKFITLNPQVNGTLPGSATLQREGDKFFAYVRLFGGAPEGWHQQNVYEGTRCPTLNDDRNGDGYIDVVEGNAVWGKILIPLDSNLSSQKAGRNIYPMADASGSYFYERETSFKKLYRDLKSDDKDMNDDYVKLAPESGIDFTGKVVVVFGTASSVIYPATVASNDNRPVHQTLPIACGVFSQLTSIPGEPLPSEVPGPSAPPTGEIGEVPPETEPVPTPVPYPGNDGRDDDYSSRRPERERSPWYRRISDWWRRTWENERGLRRQEWSNGREWWPF